MTREADVVRSLVEMADTLVDDYDVVDLLTGLADLATLSIVQHRATIEAQRLNEQLSGALTNRVIEQAKGGISERAGVDLAEAYARLRDYARNGNLRLTDVAQAAVDGSLDPLAWTPPAHSAPC